ncbi:MAG: hypothetical protein IJ875_03575 [Solobacterium sp.]|nr:hypothetical protein [Solobacterium sp.]
MQLRKGFLSSYFLLLFVLVLSLFMLLMQRMIYECKAMAYLEEANTHFLSAYEKIIVFKNELLKDIEEDEDEEEDKDKEIYRYQNFVIDDIVYQFVIHTKTGRILSMEEHSSY